MPRVSSRVDFNKDLVAFGTAVRARRKEMGLSQEALADLAGIDRSHMGKIERGERNVTLLNMIRIAKALHIRLSMLVAQIGECNVWREESSPD